MMRKNLKDLINRYFESELKEDERKLLFSILKEDENAYNYFKKLEILKGDLKRIKDYREKISLEKALLEKIRKDATKRRVSLSLGFALVFTLILFMIFPLNQKENLVKFNNFQKANHKFLITTVINNSNIDEIEITLYVKDEKIEEKTGNLKIPKDEFNLLYETLSDKGEVYIEKIVGGSQKSDFISVKINYKNYPEKSLSYYFAIILPYFIISILLILPMIFIIYRKRKLLR